MRERKIEKYLIKSPKQMLMVIAVFTLMIFVGGTTYAFFNYTRTGEANTIRVGRISFVTRQTKTISLTNLFPIDPTNSEEMSDATKVGTLEIEIEGDTDYSGGVEYLVSSENTHITTSTGKLVPISLEVTPTNLGTENANYFTAREDKNATIYKKLVGDTIVGDQMLLVGYIKPNTTSGTIEGINGKLTIKAYLDKNKISISDTYDGTESDINGTTNNWVDGRVVLTTEEWNNISSTGVSFQVKVEANEGIWVIGSLEEIMRKDAVMDNINSDYVNNATPGINFGENSSDTNGKGVYIREGTENDKYPVMYYRGDVKDNNVMFANHCWKTVRTTDTGGVKLIYNGEPHYEYEDTYEKLQMEDYINITSPYREFSFDESDKTWNITASDFYNNELLSFSFKVPAGSNYKITAIANVESPDVGSLYIMKNGTSLKFTNGTASSLLTYDFNSLTADDYITVKLYKSEGSTVTLKIKMEQDSVALDKNTYNIMGNFEYDETENKWITTFALKTTSSIAFSVSEPGDYYINFNPQNSGNFNIYRDKMLISSFGGPGISKELLIDLKPNEKIIIIFENIFQPNYYEMDFYLSKAENNNVQLGCDNNGGNSHISLNINGTENNVFCFGDDECKYGLSSIAYAGYMHGTTNDEHGSIRVTSSMKFGKGFIYENGIYKLTESTNEVDETRRYTCLTTSDICDGENTGKIYYLYTPSYGNKNMYNYIKITDGKDFDQFFEETQLNNIDSNAKSKIDMWYTNNMNDFTNRLEDTIYCNDRTMVNQLNDWNHQRSTYYKGAERTSPMLGLYTPSLECINKNDAFTVNNVIGNQKLTYPIGLLTADEMLISGVRARNYNHYLFTGTSVFSMTPHTVDGPSIIHESYAGVLTLNDMLRKSGLRPAISIKPGQLIKTGTGTAIDPYVIE